MEKRARLAVVHRNVLFGECLASALESGGRVQATNVRQCGFSHGLEHHRFDAVLIDLTLEELAFDLISRLSHDPAGVKILLLIPPDCQVDISRAIAAGVDGCVLEDVSLAEVQEAIACVLAGRFVSPPQLVQTLFARLAGDSFNRSPQWRRRVTTAELTDREFEIVNLIADGLSNKQIARRLGLSLYTVKNHVHKILQKLQVNDRLDAVSHVRSRGWLAKAAV